MNEKEKLAEDIKEKINLLKKEISKRKHVLEELEKELKDLEK